MSRIFFRGDLNYWRIWANFIASHGLTHAYDSGTDYNPLYLYVLYFYGKLQSGENGILNNVHVLKIFTLIFDFAAALSVMFFIDKKHENRSLLPFIFLLNFSYLYNTMAWGQVDAIFSALTLFALISIRYKYVSLGFVFYLLAINAKLQAIVFAPLILIVLFIYKPEIKIKEIAITLVLLIGLQFIIVYPFIMGSGIQKLIDVNLNAVDRYPVLSMSAFNFWHLLFDTNLMTVSDTIDFGGLSYKEWGMLFFVFFSALVILPLFLKALISVFLKEKFQNHALTFLVFGAIPLLFFYFNTQMHERYSHPALLFLGFYAILSNRYTIFILTCIAYLLNMEAVLQFLGWHNYDTLIFHPKFISSIYLSIIGICFYHIYRYSDVKSDFKILFTFLNNKN